MIHIDWTDFNRLGWIRTPYGQYEFSKGPLTLTLLEPDFGGRAQLIVQACSDRRMSERSFRFPIPIAVDRYNEMIAMIETSASLDLDPLKFRL